VLKTSIEQRRIGLDGLHAVRFQLLALFPRIRRMQDFIDEAFGGSPFLPHAAPDSPLNTQRVRAYMAHHKEVLNLSGSVVDLWMRAGGMKSEDNWVPLLIEEMRQTAAAKAMRESAKYEK
jgi:hypothetical protein